MTRRVHDTEGVSPTIQASNEGILIKSDLSTCSEESEASTLDSTEPIIINQHISARNPNRKNAHKGGSGLLMSREHCYAVESKPHFVASGQTTSTNTPPKSTKNIGQKPQKLQATLGESTSGVYPTTTSFVQDFHANPSLLQEEGKVSKTLVERYSSRYAELSKLKNLSYFSSKTLKDYSTMTEEERSASSFNRWMNWGTGSNGRFLTANISEYPRIGKECSLSDILEEQVDEKYFLSENQVKSLINKT